MHEFDAWAVYYDFVHTGLPGETAFYVDAAISRMAPCLELGCGTGRIALPMAMSGISVTGLDISPSMLAVCQEKLRLVAPICGSLALIEGDMCDFHLGRTFDLIVMPYRTFMHCLTPKDQLACLVCVREHLSQDGEFLMNLWAPQPQQWAAFRTAPHGGGFELAGNHMVPGEGITLVHYCDLWRDPELPVLHERHRIYEKNLRGKTLCQQDLTITRALITLDDITNLAQRAGLEILAQHGGFDNTPFTVHSTELVVQMRRNP